jgi:preprotein translocase subunit SecD
MNKNLKVKTLSIIGILLVFLWGIFLGTDPKASVDAMRKTTAERGMGWGIVAGIGQNIHLGLDLKGGLHMILQVMADEAVGSDSQRAADRLETAMKTKNIPFTSVVVDPTRVDRIVTKGISAEQNSAVRDIASEQLAEFDSSSDSAGNLILTMRPSIVRDTKAHAVAQSIEIIRGRIDTLGVSEPVIEEHGLGENQILVQLPGVDDPSRVKDIITKTGMLEIKQAFGSAYPTEQEAQAAAGGLGDKMVLPGNSIGSNGASGYYVVSRSSVVAGRDVRDATVGADTAGRPAVNFQLTGEAGDRFGAFTRQYQGTGSLAVVVSGRVKEVATINAEIHDSGIIEGGFNEQSAKDLALVLRSGALPASIRYLDDEVVSASLGRDSIRQGVTAAVVGMLLVMVFMLIYYRGAGVNADLALFLNLIILLGFMGFSGAVLTLPGIAGVILTIGMGVDSNVLIFERIREELRAGKVPSQAVDQGFGRAWLTIVDTHITTIVSAAILFLFGTGPVKGFAVTLVVGLLANLFTAVFVSRVIFDAHLVGKERGEPISV